MKSPKTIRIMIICVIVLIVVTPGLVVHSFVRPAMKRDLGMQSAKMDGRSVALRRTPGPESAEKIRQEKFRFLSETTARRSDPWYYKLWSESGFATVFWGIGEQNPLPVELLPLRLELLLGVLLLALLFYSAYRGGRSPDPKSNAADATETHP